MSIERQLRVAENEARLKELALVGVWPASRTDLELAARVEGDEGDLAQIVIDGELAHRIFKLRAALEAQVATALDQIALGRYGICADCHHEIPAERLEFLPETIRCVGCQAAEDRRG